MFPAVAFEGADSNYEIVDQFQAPICQSSLFCLQFFRRSAAAHLQCQHEKPNGKHDERVCPAGEQTDHGVREEVQDGKNHEKWQKYQRTLNGEQIR